MATNSWQWLDSPESCIFRHAVQAISMRQFHLNIAVRGRYRVEETELPLRLERESSSEAVVVFLASSADVKVELRFYLQDLLTVQASLTPLTRAAQIESLTFSVEKLMVGAQGKDMRVFKQGYQSWSETHSFGVEEREHRPLMRWLDVLQSNPRNRASHKRGEFTSQGFTIIQNPQHGQTLLLGQQPPFRQILSFRSFFPLNRTNRNEFQIQWRWDLGGQQLAIGEDKPLDEVVILAGSDASDLQERYLESLKPETIHLNQPLPSGWCSWYYYYTKVTGADIEENAACAARHPVDWQFFVLDDGYQNAISDWLMENEKFSDGLAHIAETVEAAGMRPGIWTAPFITMKNSKLAQEHPDWLLKQAYNNRPVLAGWSPGWGGNFFALDVTHPGVQAYLREVFTTFTKEYGFRFLKLDFIYAAALAGQPYNPAYSTAERLTLGCQIIREAAGEDVFILGCGSPLTPVIGLVDGMRIGPDVAPYWTDWKRTVLTRDSNALSTRAAIRSILNRAQLHRALWINDPDCLMMRDTETKLNRDERFALINAAIITAGMGVFSDKLEALPEDTWVDIARIREFTLACDQGKAYVLDFMERAMPEVVYNSAGYLAVFNFDDQPRQKVLELSGRLAKALPVGAKLMDVWNQVQITVPEGPLALRSMPPHSSRLFKIAKEG